MANITNYKCPACTGPLHFVGSSGMLECDYCGGKYNIDEMNKMYSDKVRGRSDPSLLSSGREELRVMISSLVSSEKLMLISVSRYLTIRLRTAFIICSASMPEVSNAFKTGATSELLYPSTPRAVSASLKLPSKVCCAAGTGSPGS